MAGRRSTLTLAAALLLCVGLNACSSWASVMTAGGWPEDEASDLVEMNWEDFWDTDAALPVGKIKNFETVVDYATGEQITVMKVYLTHARLVPSVRSAQEVEMLAQELTRMLADAGMTSRAMAVSHDTLAIQGKDSWEEMRDVVWQMDEVFDVKIDEENFVSREGRTTEDFDEAWEEVFGGRKVKPLTGKYWKHDGDEL